MATKAKKKVTKKPAKKKAVKTSVKPAKKKTGNGGVPVPKGKLFSKDHQPPAEAKAAGWARKLALKDLLKLVSGQKFSGDKKNYTALAAKFFGLPPEEVTLLMTMEFRMIEKAIKDKDTSAFNAVMDRAFGKVKQAGEDPQHLVITIKGKS